MQRQHNYKRFDTTVVNSPWWISLAMWIWRLMIQVMIQALKWDCFVTSLHSLCLLRVSASFSVSKWALFFFFLITYIPINKFQVNCFGATWFVQQDPKYTPSWTSWALWIKLSLVGCDGLWLMRSQHHSYQQLISHLTLLDDINFDFWQSKLISL